MIFRLQKGQYIAYEKHFHDGNLTPRFKSRRKNLVKRIRKPRSVQTENESGGERIGMSPLSWW